MTLTDYAKFIRLFLTDGGGLLKPETVTHLTTPQPGAAYALGPALLRRLGAEVVALGVAPDGDNINRLRAGRILAVPDKETAAAIDQAEAQRLVVAQGQDFNEYRRRLASSAPAHSRVEGPRRRISHGVASAPRKYPSALAVFMPPASV